MKMAEIETVYALLHARFETERAALLPLLKQEAQIQAALASLTENARRAQEDRQAVQKLQAFGGDILWQTWVERHRKDLNMQLARRRAESSHQRERLKRLDAQMRVVETLRVKLLREHRKRCQKREDQALLDSIVLRHRAESPHTS